jgi:hypothetical protein
MRADEFLIEYRRSLLQYIQGWFPDWPDYVIRDWLYPSVKDLSQSEIEGFATDIAEEYPVHSWKLQTLDLRLESFTQETQQRILSREGGASNPMKVPRDSERHAVQAQKIKHTGAVSSEPIIVIQRAGVKGLELVEGWHRTIQNLKAFPDGYHGRAWIGYTE